jgi:IS4 transposase
VNKRIIFLRIETHPEDNTIEGFYDKEHTFGTIAVITDLKEVSAEKVYQYLKARKEIEQLFDIFKNVLKADRTFMRNDYALEAWMLINFLSLQYYYRIYQMLLKRGILSRYSVSDVVFLMSKIRKVKVSTQWISLEIPKKTKRLMEALNVHIT